MENLQNTMGPAGQRLWERASRPSWAPAFGIGPGGGPAWLPGALPGSAPEEF